MSASNKTIQSRTVVGMFSAVNEIITLHNSKGAINKNQLIWYSDLFSETDEDVGHQ